MTDEQMRIKIAEACGWKRLGNGLYAKDGFHGRKVESDLPDYLNDLNAMHEAEKVLTRSQQSYFLRSLVMAHGFYDMWLSIHTTARQRAEAFIRTLGI